MGVVSQVIRIAHTQPAAAELQDRDKAAFRRHIQAAPMAIESHHVGLHADDRGPRDPPGLHIGGEQRQICAGIRNSYTPEELVGKQIIVVTNLETAKLRGMESQGMLLAASDGDRVIIMTPEKLVQAGAQVK